MARIMSISRFAFSAESEAWAALIITDLAEFTADCAGGALEGSVGRGPRGFCGRRRRLDKSGLRTFPCRARFVYGRAFGWAGPGHELDDIFPVVAAGDRPDGLTEQLFSSSIDRHTEFLLDGEAGALGAGLLEECS